MAPLAGYKASVFVSVSGPTTPLTNEPMTNAGDNLNFFITAIAHSYLDPLTAVVVQSSRNELQTITITGSPTGGTFTLSFGGNTTTAIAYNATAATVQAALVALASIGAGNALVTGGPGPATPWVVMFQGTKANTAQALITAAASLTGGSTPAIGIVETQAGSAMATITSGFTLNPCGGVVTFNNVQTGAQILSGNYITVSEALQATAVDLQAQIDIVDITPLSVTTPWKIKMALLGDATIKLTQWWIDTFYISSLGNLIVCVMYTGANANQRFQCYGLIKTDSLKFDVKSVNQESIDIESSGPVTAYLS